VTRAFGASVLFFSFVLSGAPGAQAPSQAATPVPAQTPAQPAPAQPATPAAPAPPTPAQPAASAGGYAYEPEGRRDPFVNLNGTGNEPKLTTRSGEGPAGLAVADLSVRGVMVSRGSLVAMIEGPDKRTYIVHQGDKLLDGTIKSITPQGLIVEQVVNDPLSLVKRREIRKLLKTLEDTKG
jgi:type IV pilus assembly protein PilP